MSSIQPSSSRSSLHENLLDLSSKISSSPFLEKSDYPTLIELSMNQLQENSDSLKKKLNLPIIILQTDYIIELANHYRFIRSYINPYLGKKSTQLLTEADAPLIIQKNLSKELQQFLELRLAYLNPLFLKELKNSGHNVPRLLAKEIYEEEKRIRDTELENIWRRELHLQLSNLRFNILLPGKHANAEEIKNWFKTKPDLRKIRELDFEHLCLNFLPDVINNFAQLKSIRLAHNDIRIIDEPLANLSELEDLDLFDNQIKILHGDFLKNLPKLRYLNLGENLIPQLPGDFFNNNPDLQILYVHQNEITKLDINIFKNNPNLNELYLCCNRQLSELQVNLFQGTKIRHISIENTQVPKQQIKILRKKIKSLNYTEPEILEMQKVNNCCIYL